MGRPSVQTSGMAADERIRVKVLLCSEQVAIRLCGYLHDAGFAANVCTIGDHWGVEVELTAGKMPQLNFAFYLVEDWIRA